MMNLTAETIEKARGAKSAEELLEIAKANGVEITADEARTYFEQINAPILDDDLLEGVAGGWIVADSNPEDDSTDDIRKCGRKGHC